jgi:hypothetical protein
MRLSQIAIHKKGDFQPPWIRLSPLPRAEQNSSIFAGHPGGLI